MGTGHEIAMALRRAYWVMHRQADSYLQPLGVTANQFVLLALLSQEDGITQRELVQRASSDPNTIRAMVVALEEKGIVVRKSHPRDGRAWCVHLSTKGRRTYQRLVAESEPFRSRLMSVLHPGEAELLLELLNRITVNLSTRDLAATFHVGKNE